MGFFSSVFGGATAHDPTVDWTYADDLPTPIVQLATRQVGPLKFGDSLDAARGFGRPDGFKRVHADYFELTYARAGFRLDFEGGRLVYAAFFIDRDPLDPALRNLRHCQPREQGGRVFSAQMTRQDLETAFGPPASIDSGSDETIVNFVSNGLWLEIELGPKGHLKRWNIFPKEEIAHE
jgi:hypothetical protein